MNCYKIADLILSIQMNTRFIPPEFSIFKWEEEEKSDIWWTVLEESPPNILPSYERQDMGCFQLCRYDNKVVAIYPEASIYEVPMIVYEDNFAKATYYLPQGYGEEKGTEEIERLSRYFFSFFQESFFLAMLFKGGISIHSVSILYRGKGIVFSALSGTGKTTHATLWKERYGTEILDGDVTICRLVDGKPMIYGLPWSGSSNTFLNQAAELGGIVFLQQSKTNEVFLPDFAESFERLMARSFTALWYEEFLDLRFEIIMNILSTKVVCHVLNCTPDYEAAQVIKDNIDKNWD